MRDRGLLSLMTESVKTDGLHFEKVFSDSITGLTLLVLFGTDQRRGIRQKHLDIGYNPE